MNPGSAWGTSLRIRHALGMLELVDRELESIAVSDIVSTLPLDRIDECGVDVSQDVRRHTLRRGLVPCLTPGAKPLLLSRMRVVHGIEFLRFQGIHLGSDMEALLAQTFENDGLQHLGGNSFHVLNCAAAVRAAWVHSVIVTYIMGIVDSCLTHI